MTDPRAYGTPECPVGTFQPIFDPGSSPYAQAIKTTPGLVQWWRFDTTFNGGGGDAPGGFANVYPNYWGPSTLGITGTVQAAPSLIPSDPANGAARLVKSGFGNLRVGDYVIHGGGGNECFTQEIWHKGTAAGFAAGNYSLGGAWDGTQGWMVYMLEGGRPMLFIGNQYWLPGIVLAPETVYHLVFVFGGPDDYASHFYVNGVEVASKPKQTLQRKIIPTSAPFEVGKYNNGGGEFLDGVIDEFALYNRMLQPAEVAQHYAAAFDTTPPEDPPPGEGNYDDLIAATEALKSSTDALTVALNDLLGAA